MIDSSMITDFIVEAQEQMEELESSLLRLEYAVDDPETINAAFRAVHTIKGSAQFVGVKRVAELSHKLENLLELVRQGEKTLNQEIIDTLIDGKDRIALLAEDLRNYQEERASIEDILARIKKHEDMHNGIENIPPGRLFEHEYDLAVDGEKIDCKVEKELEPAVRMNAPLAELEQKPDHFFDNEKESTSHAQTTANDTAQTEKKSPLQARPDIDSTSLKNEIEAEEHDEELFHIFSLQLQKNISLLRTLSGNLIDAPDKFQLIIRCSDLISRLHSSANYMGYDLLTAFYSQWIAELEMNSHELSNGKPASFDFMDRNLRIVAEAFPGIEKINADQASAEKVDEETNQPSAAALSAEGNVKFAGIKEKLPESEQFSDLFGAVDEANENDFTDNSPIITALPEKEPDKKPEETREQSADINVQLTDLEDKLDQFFDTLEESTVSGAEPEKKGNMPIKESSRSAQPIIDIASLKEEVEVEDFDEELFLIFIQQLQENISLLRTLIKSFSTAPNMTSLINQCSDLVTALHSSANYMGYEKLTEFYGQWIAELEMTDLQLSIGNPVSFDFMDTNIRTITRIFPQIEDVKAKINEKPALYSNEQIPMSREMEPVAAMSEESGKSSADEIDFASSEDEYDQAHPELADEDDNFGEDVSFDETFVQNREPLADSDVRRKELFAKLSGALESLANVSAESIDQEEDPGQALSLLKEEIQNEEYDQDLLAVYIQLLQKNIIALQGLTNEYQQAEDKLPVLRQCADLIEKLRSSSNYMDYEHLEKFYRQWQQDINLSLHKLSDGQPVRLDYMPEKIDTIRQVFAGLIELPDEIPPQAYHGAEMDEKEKIPETSSKPVHTLPFADEQMLFERLSNALDAEMDSLHHNGLSGAFDTETDQMLFDKLSNALDMSEFGQQTAGLKSIDDVINEILTGEGLATTETTPLKSGQHPSGMKMDFSSVSPDTAAAADKTASRTGYEQPAEHTLQRTDGADRRLNYTDRRRGPEERRLTDPLNPPQLRQSIQVDTGKIDHLVKQVGELVISRSNISQLYNDIGEMHEYLRKTARLNPDELRPLHDYALRMNEANTTLGRVSSEIQDGVLNVRMRPIAHLFKRYPRYVRDLVHQTDKKVNFKIRGEDTEMDKTILEEISGPLIHIIRNSIDHGIETVEERRRAGKDE
ncbi:MAG: Hpt domain-containing protein, partial [Desulfobulbaceae bacterium]|nr:Hpt domain-containing protein [Desulfobulbaceae bacterium]